MTGRIWVLVAILLTPVAVWPGPIDPMQFRNAVFIVAGLALVVWRLPNWWVRGFFAWAIVSFVVAGMTWWGMAGLLGLLAWGLFYAEAARLPPASWGKVRLLVLVACAFQVAWMLFQATGIDPVFQGMTWRGERVPGPPQVISGWFLNPMDASLFFGLAAPFVAAINPWFLLLLAIPILFWLKASIGVGALAIMAVWVVRQRPILAMVFAGLSLIGAGTYAWAIDPQGFGAKPLLWKSLLLLSAQTPITGNGPNALTYRVRTFQPVPLAPGDDPMRHETLEWNFAFNEWVQGALEFGAVGIALAIGYLFSLLWRLRRTWLWAGECVPALAIIFLASCVSIPFRIGPIALLAALYLGRLEAVESSA